jgi:hypothetical protein
MSSGQNRGEEEEKGKRERVGRQGRQDEEMDIPEQ